MKKLLFFFFCLFSINAMAVTEIDCLQSQVSAFNNAKLEKTFLVVEIGLNRSSATTFLEPLVKVQGQKLIIKPLYDTTQDGLCIVATSQFIEEEVSRLQE